MTRRGRDVYSLRRNCLQTMLFKALQIRLQSIACQALALVEPSWSTSDLHSRRSPTQVLRFEGPQCSQVVSSSTLGFGAQSLNCSSYGHRRSNVLICYNSYQTFATHAEKPDAEVFLDRPDEREEIKLALAEYFKVTHGLESKVALDISQNCPVFLDGLLERLKVLPRDSSVDLAVYLNGSVPNVLGRSRVGGVEALLESLGFNPQEVTRVREYARSGIKGVLMKIDLLKGIGVKLEDIPKVVFRNPRLLSNALLSHQVRFQYLAALGMSADEICKMIITYPKCLSFVLKEGSLPLLAFLKTAGVKDEEMSKVLVRCPQLLTLSIERKLQPALESLQSVGITGSSLRRVLVVQPSLLRRKLDRNIAFCREFGLEAKPGVIGRLLLTCPNLSVEGWKARVGYLESIGLTKDQIISMINKNPAFMSLNVQTALAPKVEFVMNVMGRPLEDVAASSTFLTLSLEHRIRPRYTVLAALKEHGYPIRAFSLNTMGSWRNEYFYERFVKNSPEKIQEMYMSHSSTTAVQKRFTIA